MSKATLVGKAEARKAALASIARAQATFAKRLEEVVVTSDIMIKSLTPVNTGQAVRNYIWTVNEPNLVLYAAIDNGPPGHTNAMALGAEPRRRPNEEAAGASLLALNFTNPFQRFILANLAPDIEGLELGILPGAPLKSRSPNGMFGIVHYYLNAKVSARGMLK